MENKINLRKNKKGVFGLSAIQTFFVMLLGIALLAYVIVVIMGTLSNTANNILPSPTAYSFNESQFTSGKGLVNLNQTGYTVNSSGAVGFSGPTVTSAWANSSSGYTIVIPLSNITSNGAGVIRNSTINGTNDNISLSYAFSYNSASENQTASLLGNVSNGVTSFFSSISPVFAILAVLVIILVLVVLIRVVQAPAGGQSNTPQL